MSRTEEILKETNRLSEIDNAPEVSQEVAPTANLIEVLTDQVCDQITESLDAVERVIERRIIIRVLKKTGGNITKAAQILGVKRPTLSYKIKKLKIKID